MYTTVVIIDHDTTQFEELFAAEEKSFGRSGYTITRKGDTLEFLITANDATAFKIAVNTIAKIFQVWEKMRSVTS